MAGILHFYFDFVSPYAFLAHARLPAIAKQHRLELRYHPIDLDRLKTATGNTGPSTRQMPIKHRHLRLDLQRWARAYDITLVPPSGYGSKALNCGTYYAIAQDAVTAYVAIAWRRVWGEGGDMASLDLLTGIADEMGWEAGAFLDFVGSAATQDRFDAETRDAITQEIFGVPTMIFGKEMWWGNDRLHFLQAHLEGIAA